MFSYSIKLVNPLRKTEYRIYNMRDIKKFTGVASLESFIRDTFKEYEDYSGELSLGYVKPGHGWKGQQKWINSDEDVWELYAICKDNKRSIMLWCYLPSTSPLSIKRPNTNTSDCSSKRLKCVQSIDGKIGGAKSTFDLLREKHGKKYTAEQLHAWAQLIEMKRYESLEESPDYPAFASRKQNVQKKSKSDEADGNSIKVSGGAGPSSQAIISPTKKINMRMLCIEQLQKIGELKEKGNITQVHYDKLQDAIMQDILYKL